MIKTTILGMCLAGVAPARAQSTLTLPAKGIHTSQVGRGFIVPAKDKLPTRQQCLYSTKDLPVSAMAIREIAFQPSLKTGAGMEAVQVTLSLDMSIGPKEPRKWSKTFALNLGKTVTRVFSGSIQLPKITKITRPGWYFRIPLQRPFIISKIIGPALVLDFHTTAVVTRMNQRWILMQGTPDRGTLKFQGQGVGFNCHFLKRPFLAQYLPGWVFVGSKWSWAASNLEPNAPGFLTIGDAGWGSKWAGLTLPIDLKIFGAPRCTWDVRPLLTLPFVVDSKTWAQVPGLLIPKDPRLANVKFYFQGAYAYPKANPLGWLFLPSLEQRIGSGRDHRAAALGIEKNNPLSKNGIGVLGDPVPYLRITY